MKEQIFHLQLFPNTCLWIKRNPLTGLAFLFILTLCLSGFTQKSTPDNPKIAVIDLDRVAILSKAGKELQERLNLFQKNIQSGVDQLAKEAEDIHKRITDGATSLSEEKLAELQQAYEEKQIDLRRYRDNKQREGQKLQNDGLKEIERQLQPAIMTLVNQMGVDLLLNNTPGIVVYANENIDLTDGVVALLNK